MAFTIVVEDNGSFRSTERIQPATAMLVALTEEERGADSVRIIDNAGIVHDIPSFRTHIRQLRAKYRGGMSPTPEDPGDTITAILPSVKA